MAKRAKKPFARPIAGPRAKSPSEIRAERPGGVITAGLDLEDPDVIVAKRVILLATAGVRKLPPVTSRKLEAEIASALFAARGTAREHAMNEVPAKVQKMVDAYIMGEIRSSLTAFVHNSSKPDFGAGQFCLAKLAAGVLLRHLEKTP